MKELYQEFFEVMEQMKRIKIGDLFSDMTKVEGVTLMTIEHLAEKYPNGVTVSGMAEKMHVKAPAVSRSLKSLEERGYIERTIHPSDRRNTYVKVTEDGREKCALMWETMGSFASAVLDKMNEDDLRRLIGYLRKLNQVACDEIETRKKRGAVDEQNI